MREIERESGRGKKVGRTAKIIKMGGELPGVECDKRSKKGVSFYRELRKERSALSIASNRNSRNES